MKTELLNNQVMNALESIRKNVEVKDVKSTSITRWGCGGGCEGLSTPIA